MPFCSSTSATTPRAVAVQPLACGLPLISSTFIFDMFTGCKARASRTQWSMLQLLRRRRVSRSNSFQPQRYEKIRKPCLYDLRILLPFLRIITPASPVRMPTTLRFSPASQVRMPTALRFSPRSQVRVPTALRVLPESRVRVSTALRVPTRTRNGSLRRRNRQRGARSGFQRRRNRERRLGRAFYGVETASEEREVCSNGVGARSGASAGVPTALNQASGSTGVTSPSSSFLPCLRPC